MCFPLMISSPEEMITRGDDQKNIGCLAKKASEETTAPVLTEIRHIVNRVEALTLTMKMVE